MIKKIQNLSFHSFMKIVVFLSLLAFITQTLTNYIWPSSPISFEKLTLTSAIAYTVGIGIMLYWYDKIKKGSKNDYVVFKWVTIILMIATPFQELSDYYAAKELNLFYGVFIGAFLASVFNFFNSFLSYIYITHYWQKHFEKKSK